MWKRKLIQLAAAVVVMTAVGGSLLPGQYSSAETNHQFMKEEAESVQEDASLSLLQKENSNVMSLSLHLSKGMNQNIASLEASIQLEAEKVKSVSVAWSKDVSDGQCKSVYDHKTGVLKLYVVHTRDLVNEGTIQLGTITVESSQKTEVVSALTLESLKIVDLGHRKHNLTVGRQPQFFICVPSISSKPDTTPKPIIPPSIGGSTSSSPEINQKPESGPVKVKSIKMDQLRTSLTVGGKKTLKAQVLPSNADNPAIKWVSSDTSVATVSSKGVVNAKRKGVVTVTAVSVENSNIYAKVTVVVNDILAQKIALSQSKVSLLPKETKTLSAKITPANTTNQTLLYKSSNPKVASVTKDGKITAKKAGSAKITVTAAGNKNVTAVCQVTVSNLIVDQSNVKIKKGKTFNLTVRAAGKRPKVTYQSSNTKVAVVAQNGKITAKRKGKAVITVKANGVMKKVNVVVQ